MSGDAVNFFFTLREQIKLYHWQTKSFARHKATDDVIVALDESIDTFVETYMGKYGRPKMTTRNNVVRVRNLSESSILVFIKSAIRTLEGPLVAGLDPKRDTDLFNVRDEMLGELNKLLYLFTLR